MIGLLPYIDHILRFAGQSTPDKGLGKMDTGRLLFWVALVMGCVSYVMIVAGLTIHLMNEYDAPMALCSVGLITLLTMLLMLGAHKLYFYLRRKKMQKMLKEITNDVSGLSEDILSKFDNSVKDNALLLAAVSAAIGYMISRKIY